MFCFKTMANPILWQGKELTEGILGKGGAFYSCRRSCTRIGKSRRRSSVWYITPSLPPSPYVAFSFLYVSVLFHWLSHTANCAYFGFSTALDQSHGILSPSMPPSHHPSLPPTTLRISWEVALDRGNTHVRSALGKVPTWYGTWILMCQGLRFGRVPFGSVWAGRASSSTKPQRIPPLSLLIPDISSKMSPSNLVKLGLPYVKMLQWLSLWCKNPSYVCSFLCVLLIAQVVTICL